jgi:hypothetical protein
MGQSNWPEYGNLSCWVYRMTIDTKVCWADVLQLHHGKICFLAGRDQEFNTPIKEPPKLSVVWRDRLILADCNCAQLRG